MSGYDEYHPYGDGMAANEPPEYPAEWSAEERVSAYWYALNRGIRVRSSNAWESVLVDARRTAGRHVGFKRGES